MTITCSACQETFEATSALYDLGIMPVPTQCCLCRLLPIRESKKHDAVNRTAAGVRMPGKVARRPRAAPREVKPREQTQHTRESIFAAILAWIDAHDGAVPLYGEFSRELLLPSYRIVRARIGPLLTVYAALDAQGYPGILAQYSKTLKRRRVLAYIQGAEDAHARRN